MKKRINTGDIVIATNPHNKEIIKRVDKIEGNRVFLLGDNPGSSTDSRDFGYLEISGILGVVIMKIKFAKATPPPIPASRRYLAVPGVLAALTVVMLLCQLYTSEEFVYLFQGYGLGELPAKMISSLMLVAQLFALPFWLGMRLSPLARTLSAALGVLFPLYWLLFSLAPMKPASLGYFGTVLPLEGAYLNTAIALVLVALSWASFYILGGKSLFKDLNKPKS